MRFLKLILKKIGIYGFVTNFYDHFILRRAYQITKKELKKSIISYDLIFLFPFHHTGGAEFVHLNIVRACKGKALVVFTQSSANTHYLAEFKTCAKVIEIDLFLKKAIYKKALAQVIVQFINKKRQVKLFSCHTLFFYHLLPQLDAHVQKIDLIHAFTHPDEPGAEKYSLPFVKYLNRRIVISQKAKDDLYQWYKVNGIDLDEAIKILVIPNCASFTCEKYPEKSKECFKIVYVGRNSPEKRIATIGKLATKLRTQGVNFSLIMIGENLIEGVNPEDRANCEFTGGIRDLIELKQLYQEAHCVLITSHREGMPMAIMEGMLCGCVPVTTDVGAVKEHVVNGVNGFVVENSENAVLTNAFECIIKIIQDEAIFSKYSMEAYRYAKDNFTKNNFVESYQSVLLN